MSNMDNISEQLFAKIRGRFPSVTLGDEEGVVTDEPKLARYFDFDYKVGEDSLGKVSIALTEKEVAVMYNNTFVSEQPDSIKTEWYEFLKELRNFSRRNIGKNTSRFSLLDYFSTIKKMNKDNKWIQENLKKLELHKTFKK